MSEIQQGLIISGIGMGLVFAVIIFLWGLMAVMMKLTSGKQKAEEGPVLPESDANPMVPELLAAESQRRAAAAAVAVQLALAKQRSSLTLTGNAQESGDLTPWQAFHRSRQFRSNQNRG